VIYFEGGKAYW